MLGLIFTYGLTIGGAFVSLFNPFIGLLVYVCFAIITPAAMWPWSVQPWPYSKVVAVAMLIGWLLKGFGQWNFNRSRGILLAFSGFLVWGILSASFAPHKLIALPAIENWAKIFIPFLVGLTLIDSISKLKQLAWVMVASLGYIAYELNLSYYQGFNKVLVMGYGSLDNNSIAIAMVAGVGMAFFLGVGANKWWQRMGAWLLALLMAHTVLLSFSRGGMLGLIVSLVISFAMLPPKEPKHFLALVICVLIGFRLAGPEVTDRFLSTFVNNEERDSSAQSRIGMWEDMWDSTLHNPIVGVGPNHWPLTAPKYGWPLGKEGHSLWLQTGVELGFPGLFFLAIFYLLCIIRLWPIIRSRVHNQDPFIKNIGRMVIAGHVGFMVAAQFVSLETLEVPYYLTLLGAGALKLIPLPESSPATARGLRFAAVTSVFLRKG